MKKTYMKPTTKVVYIHHTQLLSASPYNDQNGPLETYDEEDDVIYEKNSIW